MAENHSPYYDKDEVRQAALTGSHREVIGGLWDEIGDLQINFLKENGLSTDSRLLDIGCGSLRLGVRAVEFLDAENYWGTDLNESLLDAGYEREIVANGLQAKISRANLITDTDFQFTNVPTNIDIAIAQSVFTHLPLNHFRLCLANLAKHVTNNCTFFATTFVVDEHKVSEPHTHERAGVQTFPHRDPFHYSISDLNHIVRDLPWEMEYIGDWGHPRDQKMVRFFK